MSRYPTNARFFIVALGTPKAYCDIMDIEHMPLSILSTGEPGLALGLSAFLTINAACARVLEVKRRHFGWWTPGRQSKFGED